MSIIKMKELELENDISDEEGSCSDEDLCDTNEISREFSNSKLLFEENFGKNKYLMQLSSTNDNNPNIGVGLSDNSFHVFNLNSQLAKNCTLGGITGSIVDCQFSQDNNNLIYTCSNDGNIKLFDIRTPKAAVKNFVDSTCAEGNNKTFNCFDISPNGKLLSAGCDLFEGDAFLLFWDVRSKNLLGGYWESHTDDITQVKFHQNDSNKLISGSTDGLINIYDLSQTNEDDALIDSMNTESSIEKLTWYSENKDDYIGCCTHTADVQIWKLDDAEPSHHIKRSQIAQDIKRKSENYVYTVNTHQTEKSLLILTGSNAHDGECLRALQFCKNKVGPAFCFIDNTQRVKSSSYVKNAKVLLTGGEKGVLSAWKC
ncbi:unnamed protein product [Brassicogethes aeneus]|uniref:WD repeat-containing protein 89 n=1 Tax=Brassicogethes aeneus TaxID=1431903 RepID=A0A9P0FEJ1_BRAAE|nr:unnamed protein product [Brassicogethes aeneus]